MKLSINDRTGDMRNFDEQISFSGGLNPAMLCSPRPFDTGQSYLGPSIAASDRHNLNRPAHRPAQRKRKT